MPISTKDAVGRRDLADVIKLASPVVLSMLASSVMGLVDTWFMGRVSTPAQGAVGLGHIVVVMLCALPKGTLSGVSTYAAQYYGAGERERCGRCAWYGLALAALFALVLIPVATAAIPLLLTAFGAHGAEIAASYAAIRVLGIPAVCVQVTLASFMQGVGDSRSPMKVSLGVMALNIPLDYWLIFGGLGIPPLGARGAAIATVASSCLGALALLALFSRRRWRQELGTGLPARWRARELWSLLRLGLPMGVHWMLEVSTWAVFTGLISSLDPVQLAAHNIVLQALHLSFMPGIGIAIAATTLVGQALGARDAACARRRAQASLRLGVAWMAAMGLVFLLAGGEIARWFTPDPRVIATARVLFLWAAVCQVFDALGTVSGGVLCGAGLTRFPAAATALFAWLLLMPLAWLFACRLHGGAGGAWAAALIYFAGLGLVLRVKVRAGGWLRASVIRPASSGSHDDSVDEKSDVETPRRRPLAPA